MVKKFDSIFRVAKKTYLQNKSVPLDYETPRRTIKDFQRKSALFYFYRSAQIVLTVWIVTLVAITAIPWLDYFVKSSINQNKNSQVLGDQTPATSTPDPSETANSNIGTFYLKNQKIEIEAPIVEGIGEDSLKQGIGHHPESAWPSQKGNVVLAGHNTDLNPENPYAKVFFHLRDVSIGDEVIINYREKNYYYKIFKTETVKPNDTRLLQNVDDWMLTFYTCDPPYTDWKRLVFQAKLEKIE